MKNILFPNAGQIYKANMHAHTVFSDGRLTAEEIRDVYSSLGYQIVAYTDHEVCAAHGALAREDFLPITAYEMAVNPSADRDRKIDDKCYHLNLFSRDPSNTRHICFDPGYVRDHWPCSKAAISNHTEENRVYSVDFVNRILREAKEEGWLVSLNHPTWSMQDREDFIGLDGLWGVEVYNNECAYLGYPENDEWAYEALLRAGRPVYPLATDDIHRPEAAGGGWLMVCADALNHDAVFTAFARGDFYASTGPELHSIAVEDGILKVTCSPCSAIRVNTECRCAYRVLAPEGGALTEAEFDLQKWLGLCPAGKEENAYVRVTAVDSAGKKAWSRAYYRSEILREG